MMMQWPDNHLSLSHSTGYNPGVSASKEVSSSSTPAQVTTSLHSVNSKSVNSGELQRETSSTSSSSQSGFSTDHLQFCLSMLPPSCSFCGVHPVQWGRDEVQQWLKWCIDEFSFTDVQTEKFAMNGKALILLKKEDFIERAQSAGDVLYNVLQKLLETQSKSQSAINPFTTANMAEQTAMLNLMMAANNPFLTSGLIPGFPHIPFTGGLARGNLPTMSLPVTSSSRQVDQPVSITTTTAQSLGNSARHLMSRSHSQSPPLSKLTHHSYETTFPSLGRSDDTETKSLPLPPLPLVDSVIKPNIGFAVKKEESLESLSSPRTKGDCRLLWEFISKLLKDSNYTEYIRWENISDYTFRIVNPAQLSRLWGIQKNRTNMTYEKLSRALRYYYRMDIIEKVPGRRLTYRFMRPPHEIKRGQRGAKPGVPRKSRSTDEEAELDETEAMDTIESELSDDENRLSIDYTSAISVNPAYVAKREQRINSDTSCPLDLVSHKRRSSLYSPPTDIPGLRERSSMIPKAEPLISQLSVSQTNPSLDSVIKSEAADWSLTNGGRVTSPHLAVE